jgi:flagellar motility protein MotE (MotC chaperone)
MKNLWLMFVSGMVAVFAVGSILDESRASTAKAAEVHRVEEKSGESSSSLRNPVPLGDEVEAGLAARKQELDERERRLRESQERLAVEEERVKAKIEELERLQADIQDTQKKRSDEGTAVMSRIVKTYESMAPKKASAVLGTMEDSLAVEILMSMKEKKVAEVLNTMDPERAVKLSSLMAKRRPASSAASGVNEQAPASKGPPRP